MAEGRSSLGLLQENEFQRGRPSTEVDAEEVQFLLSKGFTKSKIPDILGVSRQTLYNRISTWGPEQFYKKHLCHQRYSKQATIS